MVNPFLADIAWFAFNFAPKGWAMCNGQQLPINQNQALFSLLGTTYGGNGQTTFALPNLRGRLAIGFGDDAPGLSDYVLGQVGGTESVTLNVNQMPTHSHVADPSQLVADARCKNGPGDSQSPAGNVPAVSTAAVYGTGDPTATMSSSAVTVGGTLAATPTGGSQPHENRQPYLAINFCIALQGLFPSRN